MEVFGIVLRSGDGKMYFQWDGGSHGKKKWHYYSDEVAYSRIVLCLSTRFLQTAEIV